MTTTTHTKENLKMFTRENSSFENLDLVNRVFAILIRRGWNEKAAHDAITNGWHPDDSSSDLLARIEEREAKTAANFFLSSEDQTNLHTACFVAAERYDEHVKEFGAMVAAETEKSPEAAARRIGYKRLQDQFEKQAREIRKLAERISEVEHA